MRFRNKKDRELQRELQAKVTPRITEVALFVADKGRGFNGHLLRQFERWKSMDAERSGDLTDIPGEHLLFYQSVAETLGWLQQAPVEELAGEAPEGHIPPLLAFYLQVILEGRCGKTKNVQGMLDKLRKGDQVRKPRRIEGVIAGLETWAAVDLPDVTDGGTLDLDEVQRRAIAEGGRARWTALAPIKMYAIHKGLGTLTPRTIYPPMGMAVSRGIQQLLGFTLGESGGDYELSRGLHLKLADLARASIWDINSGLYLIGGGS